MSSVVATLVDTANVNAHVPNSRSPRLNSSIRGEQLRDGNRSSNRATVGAVNEEVGIAEAVKLHTQSVVRTSHGGNAQIENLFGAIVGGKRRKIGVRHAVRIEGNDNSINRKSVAGIRVLKSQMAGRIVALIDETRHEVDSRNRRRSNNCFVHKATRIKLSRLFVSGTPVRLVRHLNRMVIRSVCPQFVNTIHCDANEASAGSICDHSPLVLKLVAQEVVMKLNVENLKSSTVTYVKVMRKLLNILNAYLTRAFILWTQFHSSLSEVRVWPLLPLGQGPDCISIRCLSVP